MTCELGCGVSVFEWTSLWCAMLHGLVCISVVCDVVCLVKWAVVSDAESVSQLGCVEKCSLVCSCVLFVGFMIKFDWVWCLMLHLLVCFGVV